MRRARVVQRRPATNVIAILSQSRNLSCRRPRLRGMGAVRNGVRWQKRPRCARWSHVAAALADGDEDAERGAGGNVLRVGGPVRPRFARMLLVQPRRRSGAKPERRGGCGRGHDCRRGPGRGRSAPRHDWRRTDPGPSRWNGDRVPGNSIRAASRRCPAVGAAPKAGEVEQRPRRGNVRKALRADGEPDASDRGERGRGLPVPQRLDAEPDRLEAPGHGVVSRRRQRRRIGVRPRAVRGRRLLLQRRATRGERRGCRHSELPPGGLRVLRSPGARRRGLEAGQPGAMGPALRPAVGAGEHRAVRGRPEQRHHLRRVRWIARRLHARRVAPDPASLRASHQRERRLHHASADARRRPAGHPQPRRPARLSRRRARPWWLLRTADS